jgi:hypothetical protein
MVSAFDRGIRWKASPGKVQRMRVKLGLPEHFTFDACRKRTMANTGYVGASGVERRPRAGHCLLGPLSALVRLNLRRLAPAYRHQANERTSGHAR